MEITMTHEEEFAAYSIYYFSVLNEVRTIMILREEKEWTISSWSQKTSIYSKYFIYEIETKLVGIATSIMHIKMNVCVVPNRTIALNTQWEDHFINSGQQVNPLLRLNVYLHLDKLHVA